MYLGIWEEKFLSRFAKSGMRVGDSSAGFSKLERGKNQSSAFSEKKISKKRICVYIYIITCMTVLSFDYYYIAIPGIYHFLFDSTLECSFIHLRWVLLRFNRFFLYWHGEKGRDGIARRQKMRK